MFTRKELIAQRLKAKLAARQDEKHQQVAQAAIDQTEATFTTLGAVLVSNTGKNLREFLAAHISYLNRNPEQFELVTGLILQSIAERYTQNHNIDKSWEDLTILLSFNPPHERHLPSGTVVLLNDQYKGSITQQHLPGKHNVMHIALVNIVVHM